MNKIQKLICSLFFSSLVSSMAHANNPAELAELINIPVNKTGSESNMTVQQFHADPSTLSSAALSIASITALAQYEDASNKKNESMQMPPEIKNLEETKANSASSVFKRYNYSLTGRSADYSSKTNYWWNATDYSCIAMVTYNGRINSVNRVSSSDCK